MLNVKAPGGETRIFGGGARDFRDYLSTKPDLGGRE